MDEEDKRKSATSLRDYLATAGEAGGTFRWIWNETTTPQSRSKLYRMFAWAAVMVVLQGVQPGTIGFLFKGLETHTQAYVTGGLAAFLICLLVQKRMEKLHESAREWVIGLNWGRLDDRITDLFFSKSIGQHIQQGTTLSVAAIDKGRGRLMNLQSLLLFEGIPTVGQLAVSYLLLVILSPVAGLVLGAVIGLYVAWSLYLNYQVNRCCIPIERDFRALNRRRMERWERVERVKISGQESFELADMSEVFSDIITRDRNFWLWFIGQSNMRGMVNAIGLTAVMAYGSYLVWTGRWNIGVLYPLLIWSSRVSDNIWKLGYIEHQINWNLPSVLSMIEALSIPPMVVDRPGAARLDWNRPHHIRFDALSHTYPAETSGGGNDRPSTLVRVSFDIAPGERVALLGSSGAGKTTIMKKLLRFDDPSGGSIRIDGRDLREITQASWRRGIGYIPQQSQVFDGTIRYNLTYGLEAAARGGVGDEELWKLMRLLKIDFTDRLTEGLDTVVGRNGIKLSGGQAQRLMIGAAVMRRPWLLVIDEATSSLDSTTERQVQEGLSAILSEGSTSALIVAHRLSTVRHLCTKFVILKNAHEVADGETQVEAVAPSFEELHRLSPTFRRLAHDQGIAVAS